MFEMGPHTKKMASIDKLQGLQKDELSEITKFHLQHGLRIKYQLWDAQCAQYGLGTGELPNAFHAIPNLLEFNGLYQEGSLL